KVGIIGSGNIGSDLMVKLQKSKTLELRAMMGIDPESRGMRHAKEIGVDVYDNGIDGLLENPNSVDIIFDATRAKDHLYNSIIAKRLGKLILDLTPAAVGPFIVPEVNLGEYLDADNVNLITCGGQATIPIVHAINQVAPVDYAEIVATISSASAGPGTRENIDEFTQTTAKELNKSAEPKKEKH